MGWCMIVTCYVFQQVKYCYFFVMFDFVLWLCDTIHCLWRVVEKCVRYDLFHSFSCAMSCDVFWSCKCKWNNSKILCMDTWFFYFRPSLRCYSPHPPPWHFVSVYIVKGFMYAFLGIFINHVFIWTYHMYYPGWGWS